MYKFEGHEFTFADCIRFATTTFNGWRTDHKIKADPGRGHRNVKHRNRNRRHGRQTAVCLRLTDYMRSVAQPKPHDQLSNARKKAAEAYEAIHNCRLPDEIFDPEYMSSYNSSLDTTDAESSDDDTDRPENAESGEEEREEKIKKAKEDHYRRLAKKANLSYISQLKHAPVWEKRGKSFRSEKVSTFSVCNKNLSDSRSTSTMLS